MPYQIPQYLPYKEKLLFGLAFGQLGIKNEGYLKRLKKNLPKGYIQLLEEYEKECPE